MNALDYLRCLGGALVARVGVSPTGNPSGARENLSVFCEDGKATGRAGFRRAHFFQGREVFGVALFNLRSLFGGPKGLSAEELAKRLGMDVQSLSRIKPVYSSRTLRKKGGGSREIQVPHADLKRVQRLILRRILGRLRVHPKAMGFERGRSAVMNAALHVNQAVVVTLDVKDFFGSIPAGRVTDYFRKIGWSREAAEILTRVCTFQGKLPQGAPTSPRLSNLVNIRLDHRLETLAQRAHAVYSRYADDITFSFAQDDPGAIRSLIRATVLIAQDEGYEIHQDRKVRIQRKHQRQQVTGLVVNQRVNLPRHKRRRLRAILHHLDQNKPATLTLQQCKGWLAFLKMIRSQGQPAS